MRRAFLTNFHGSAGTAVVTPDEAFLWTDSRYWNEAGTSLDGSSWTLQKAGLPSTPTIPKWLNEQAASHFGSTKQPLRVGLDPFVHPASFAKEVLELWGTTQKDESYDSCPGALVEVESNLVDEIWVDRPSIPKSPFRVHPLRYAGRSVLEKVQTIREEMKTKKATVSVFCTLDDVAYLCNLRCQGDIETCPVGIAYAVVTETNVFLYCDAVKVQDPAVQQHLTESQVTVKPYEQMVDDLSQLAQSHKVWLDTSRANYKLTSVLPKLVDSQNAITPMKACKNEAELQGMREAHIVDGAAMAKFMAWLEITLPERKVSEVELDKVLTGFRAEQPGFVECSFPTIAGVGSNGAIIHYRASDDSDLLKYLDTKTPILIDSGGQYEYGTTDVTRTWSFQETPDPTFKSYFTRVLKGNIGLDSKQFPENTPGFVLDVYAREPLWQIQKDYGHGTGHGVGAALNVHEGPMSISPRWTNKETLKAGMVLSNEPGYYEDGKFGIRVENLLEIEAVESLNPDNDTQKKFLRFKKLTMIPIQKNLIDLDLMTDSELDWLDAYHADVLAKVGPRLQEGSPEHAWLLKSCAPIERKN